MWIEEDNHRARVRERVKERLALANSAILAEKLAEERLAKEKAEQEEEEDRQLALEEAAIADKRRQLLESREKEVVVVTATTGCEMRYSMSPSPSNVIHLPVPLTQDILGSERRIIRHS